jgi:hypothetical protein
MQWLLSQIGGNQNKTNIKLGNMASTSVSGTFEVLLDYRVDNIEKSVASYSQKVCCHR